MKNFTFKIIPEQSGFENKNNKPKYVTPMEESLYSPFSPLCPEKSCPFPPKKDPECPSKMEPECPSKKDPCPPKKDLECPEKSCPPEHPCPEMPCPCPPMEPGCPQMPCPEMPCPCPPMQPVCPEMPCPCPQMPCPEMPCTSAPPFTCPYFRLAHAYVPWQYLNRVYSSAEALCNGTLFPELNMPQGQYGPCEGPRPCKLYFGGGVPYGCE